jgi:hypothetical protein
MSPGFTGTGGEEKSPEKKTKIFGGSTYMLLRDNSGEAVSAFPVEAYRFTKDSKEVTYWFFDHGKEAQIAICIDKYKFKDGLTAETIREAEYETYELFQSVDTNEVFQYIELKIQPKVIKPDYDPKKKHAKRWLLGLFKRG